MYKTIIATALPLTNKQSTRGLAALRDIRLRLNSVKNVQTITHSMKMVSATRYARPGRDLNKARSFSDASHLKFEDDTEKQIELAADSEPSSSATLDIATAPDRDLRGLERAFARFERRCQINEMVEEDDYLQLFDYFKECLQSFETKGLLTNESKGNLTLLASTLLRCCGRLMSDVSPENREKHLGDIWSFISNGPIDLDISVYNSLIRSMNENQTVFDPEKMLKDIHDKGLNPDAVTYQRLIHQYCIRGDIEKATGLLEKMKELEFNLNEQIFASLIVGYSYQEKPPAIKEMFDLMKSNGVEPSGKSLAAAIQAVTRRLSNPGVEEELKLLLDQASSEDIQLSVEDAVDTIAALSPHKNNDTAMNVIQTVIQTLGFQPSNKRVIRALLNSDLDELASKLYWSRKPTERSMANGNVGNFYLKLLVSTNRSIEFCLRECEKFISTGYNPKPYHQLYYNAAQLGRTDLVRLSLNKMKEHSKINYTLFWPLVVQAKNEKELIDVLKNDLNPDMRPSHLLDTFSDWIWPKFSENFERLFELNKELKYNNGILLSSFLRYAVREGRINDAVNLLKTKVADLHETENIDVGDSGSFEENEDEVHQDGRSPNNRRSLVGTLLNQIAEQTKDPEVVKKAFELCLIPGRPIEQGLAMPIIKAHLLNEDFKGAVNSFLFLITKYRISPRKAELIKYCLENKEAESLQKIIDALTELNGQSEALFDLAYCCVEVKKLKQAQKIFTSPGFRVLPSRIFRTCNSLLTRNRLEQLEDFVTASLNIYGIDQEGLYSILIEAYGRNKDGKRALNLYNKMQEDEFQPSKSILLKLAGVLEECGVDVPFQKPTLSASENARINRQQQQYLQQNQQQNQQNRQFNRGNGQRFGSRF